MTKEEIINETVEYYKDASKRGYYDSTRRCEYLTESGNMCAVGRCLIPGSVMMSNSSLGGKPARQEMQHCRVSAKDVTNLEQILKPEYRGHSSHFWMLLQNLHDSPQFFNNDTMNEEGLRHAKGLIKSLIHVNDAKV